MRLLVAGASGLVGREVVALAKLGGHWVRTLSRRPEAAGPVRSLADDVRLADARDPAALQGVCDGVDVVCSSLGASVLPGGSERRGFSEVDARANLNLIEEARRAGVQRFVYVSVYSTPDYAHTPYVAAHREVEQALAQSGMTWAVVRPTGVFGAIAEALVPMAKKGLLPLIGPGTAETNPVHEHDVARAVLDGATSRQAAQSIDLGGPEVMSRRQMFTHAFAAAGGRPRFIRLPAFLMTLVAMLWQPFNARMAEFLRFMVLVSTHSCVAPALGRERLAPYLRSFAGAKKALPGELGRVS